MLQTFSFLLDVPSLNMCLQNIKSVLVTKNMQQTQVFQDQKFKTIPDFQKLRWQQKQPQAHINMATEINTIKHIKVLRS